MEHRATFFASESITVTKIYTDIYQDKIQNYSRNKMSGYALFLLISV